MTQEKPEVGVVGLGIMGTAITRRLLAAGHTVRAYDVRPEAAAAITGVVPVASAAEAAAAGIVILSLNTSVIVEQAAFGDGGVVSAGPGGLLVIDMSSIDPRSTADLAGRAAGHGAAWVDAPLSGGAPAAERGVLTLMLGGTAEAVARAKTVLDSLAARTTHLGPAGAGQLVKLVNQVLVGCGFAALAEAAALIRAAGLPPADVLAALTGGRADSALVQEFLTKFVTLDLTPTGKIANMVKDLDTARDHARSLGLPLPVTNGVAELHRWLVARGHGDADNAALMHFYAGETATGQEVVA